MSHSQSYPKQCLYYNGQAQSSTSNKTFQTINPATAGPIASVECASPADVDLAILSAQEAFPAWSCRPAIERARILQRAVTVLRARNDALARIETLDTGKPLTETSTVDVSTGADVLEYYANLVASGGLNGESTSLRPGVWTYTTKQALGVCAGIGAWNYPLQIALWKSAPCLAAGNTMVYKPSEVTPLHALQLASIYAEAGLPAGVFNVVHGDGEVGAYLTAHASIAKVSFTGQVSTGQKVAASAAAGMKSVTMELGGKSPLIVLPDANIETAVDGAMMANFFSTGQVCTSGSRVFVHSDMREAFEQCLLQKMAQIRALDPMHQDCNLGPLVSATHLDKVLGYIKHGIAVDGAKLLYGGPAPPEHIAPCCKDGFWIRPTVFTNCTDEMKIVTDEIFGPVMCILTYNTVAEVIVRANKTTMGLAAGVFGSDLTQCHDTIARLDAGITWINSWGESPAEMSVGGWKMSGLGVENGRRGLDAWLREKSTLVDMSGSVPTVYSKL